MYIDITDVNIEEIHIKITNLTAGKIILDCDAYGIAGFPVRCKCICMAQTKKTCYIDSNWNNILGNGNFYQAFSNGK